MVDAQALIGPAVAALYLKDCLLLLRRDEAVLVRGLRGTWRAGFGLRDWRLADREPYLCHPFKPFEPVLRLRWSVDDPAGRASLEPAGVPAGTAALAAWAGAIWLMIFVCLPVAFYGKLGLPLLWFDLAVLYALIVGSLVVAWRRRAGFGLDASGFALLAFEVLACPPYAPNVLRRACFARPVDEEFLAASRRLLDAPRLAEARAGCRARVEEELEAIDDTSLRAVALRAARQRWAKETPHDAG